MSTDANTAASSAAVTETVAPTPDLGSLSATQRDEWLRTGSVSTPPTSDESAASSTAPPVEQAASTDATPPPASEPGTPSKEPGKGVEKRKAQLSAEIQELQEQLRVRAQLRQELQNYDIAPAKKDEPPASSAAPAIPKFPEFAQWVDLSGNANATYEDYIDARTDFRNAAHERIRQQHQQAQARQAETTERVTTYQQRMSQAEEADPEFWNKIRPEIKQLRPLAVLQPGEMPTMQTILAEGIVRSELAPQLLLHLSEHPDEFSRLSKITDPFAIPKEIGKLEATLGSPVVPATVPPPPKTVTDAPAPPPTLTPKAQAPVDEALAALHAGDFTRYRSVMNAREAAARR